MALLTKIDKPTGSLADRGRVLDISVDVGKMLTVLILGTIILLSALVLYLADKDAPAALFFSLGEAVVVGSLGLSAGERTGAAEAEAKLG